MSTPTPLPPEPTSSAGEVRPLALVVDDEPDFAELVGTWLARAGNDVKKCWYGWDGVFNARQLKPALIVTDIVMPGGVDGWDLANLLRLTGPKVPIIMMTGFSRKVVERNRTLPANVIGYLEKPFRESDLQALLPAIAPNAGAVPSA